MGTEVKREFTPERLKELERQGLTMKGGGFPIEDVGDLENAIRAIGRARDPEATKRWIIQRAKDLHREDLIPEDWESGPDDDADVDDEPTAKADDYVLSAEHKVVPVTGFKVLDDDQGIVEAMVSVTGMEDRVKDTIEPGAYTKTLSERTPRGCWGHDWNVPISKTLEIKELMPGDPGLPKTLRNGQPWPAGAGVLQVKTQFNLETQRGREAYSDVKFFGQDQEWSIGYNVPPGAARIDPKTGKRSIKSLILHEYSPVLHGAMPEAVTQSVKSAQEAYAEMIERIEDKALLADDGGSTGRPAPTAAAPRPRPGPPAKPAPAASSSSSNSVHPHQPAGSPKGGQFAPKGSGGGGSSSAPPAKHSRKGRKARHHKAVAAHAAAGGATHTVKKGDTLWAIAAKMLGSGTRWKEIARLNGIKDPRKVPIGMTLKIPSAKATSGKVGVKPVAPAGHVIHLRGHVGNAASMASKIRRDAKVKDDGSATVEAADLGVLLDAIEEADTTSDLIDVESVLVDVEADLLYPMDLDASDFVPADTEEVDEEVDDGLDDPADEPEPDNEVAGDDYPVDDVLTEDASLTAEEIALLFADPEVVAEAEENKADGHGTGNRGNAETLRRYWSTGAGAAKIAWGTEGDFDRCVTEISKYMTPEQAKGYCNLLHHRSIGIWPAQHAALDRAAAGKSVDDYRAESGYETKDVVSGSYPLATDPGLAGADGRPKMIDRAAKPGEDCPDCGDPTDMAGVCMNPDCPMFGMAVKVAMMTCDHPLDANGQCDTPGCANASPKAAKAAMLGAVKALLHDGLITPADLGLKAAKPPVDEEDEPTDQAESGEDEPADQAESGEDESADDEVVNDGGPEETPDDDEAEDEEDAKEPKGKADISLDVLGAVRFFDEAEEKGYVRKMEHGGWIWQGSPGTPDTRGRSTHASMAGLGGGVAPEGWVPGEAARISHDIQAVRLGRTGAMDKPRPGSKVPKSVFSGYKEPNTKPVVHTALKVTQPLDHPDGGRLTRDGHTFHVQNRSKGALERWKVSHPESGHSTEVSGPGSAVPIESRGAARMHALSGAVHSLLQKIGVGSQPEPTVSDATRRRQAHATGQLEHARQVVGGHAAPTTRREGRQASANLALAQYMRPRSQMSEPDIRAELDDMRRRLRTEKPAQGSLRANLVRSRIADLSTELRKRTGKADVGEMVDGEEFKATEANAQERARTIAITPAWADLDTIPPMGEYDRWDAGQLEQGREALIDTLNNAPDLPAEFTTALQGELSHIVAEQQRRDEENPVEKADSADLSGMSMEAIGQEAGRLLQRISKGSASDADKARLRELNAERKRRSKSLGVLDEAMDTETADVLTMQEVLEAERLMADLD